MNRVCSVSCACQELETRSEHFCCLGAAESLFRLGNNFREDGNIVVSKRSSTVKRLSLREASSVLGLFSRIDRIESLPNFENNSVQGQPRKLDEAAHRSTYLTITLQHVVGGSPATNRVDTHRTHHYYYFIKREKNKNRRYHNH